MELGKPGRSLTYRIGRCVERGVGMFDVMVIEVDHRVIVAWSAMPNNDVVHALSVSTKRLLGNCPEKSVSSPT